MTARTNHAVGRITVSQDPYRLAVRLIATCVWCGLCLPTASANAPKKLTTVEGITEYELDNGMEVLLFPDASKPTVTVGVTYRVGSRHEGRGEAGMAHLLEHMVFKGTPTHPSIWGALEDHGASFNGSTWVDRTNYFETLPATDENLEFAIGMEADRMVNSTISGEELAKEMTVVRNEFERGENDPVGVLSERMMSTAYLWHNYGKSTIGNRSDIERVPVENLRAFYRRYYQPDNATVLVAGKFESDKALDLIVKHFGTIPRPSRSLAGTYTEEPTQDGPRLVTLNRVGDVATAGLLYHMPSGSHPDYPAVQVVEGILTDQPSGRLYKALVEQGLATSVRGSAYAFAEPGVLELIAQVRLDNDPREVLNRMQDVVEGLASTGITDQEVDRIKTQLLKNIKLSMNDSRRIGIRMSESIALGDWRMFFVLRDRLEAVTTADVQRVARAYLLASNRTAGLFIPQQNPDRASVPATPDVAQVVDGYRSKHEIDAGEAFAATPENLEKRVRRMTLPSGIKVALLQKDTRGNAVQAAFRFHFGTEEKLTGHTIELGLIPAMLMRGTKERDFQQLNDEIDRLQSRINVGGGFGGGRGGRRGGGGGGGDDTGGVSASIESDRTHLIPAIALLSEILQKPAFATDQFDLIIQNRLTRLEQARSDPQSLGMTALTRSMNTWPIDSIHYAPSIEEQIQKLQSVSLGVVKDLYDRFYGADHVEIAIVGDFDEEQVLTALTEALGSWKKSAIYERVARPHRGFPATTKAIDTPDKEMAIVAMGTSFAMRDDDPDYPAMNLAAYVLGQSAKSRLINRLRHQGGLSYGARAGLRTDSQDEQSSLTATAICAPQNAEQALTAMREEIHGWIKTGLTDEELAEARPSLVMKMETALSDDRTVAGNLLKQFETGRTFAWHTQLMGETKALTAEMVRGALQRHLAKAPFVEIKAGDLSAKAEPTETPSETPEDKPRAETGALPERFAEFDANGDGRLQHSEAPERMQMMFERLDADKSGALEPGELSEMDGRERGGRGGQGRDPAQMVEHLKGMDENKDGFVDKNEVPERMQRMFERLDENNDGKLSPDELDKIAARPRNDR